jgi:hypothetical protein
LFRESSSSRTWTASCIELRFPWSSWAITVIGWAVLVYQLADAEGGVQLWRGCDGAGAPECAETVAGANEQEPGIRDQGIDPYRIAHDFGHSHLNTRLFLSDIEPEGHCMQWKSRSSLDGAFDDHAQGLPDRPLRSSRPESPKRLCICVARIRKVCLRSRCIG